MRRTEGTRTAPVPSMRTFFVVWAGQIVSLVGSGLTNFSLGIWVNLSGRGTATQYTLTLLFALLPITLFSPIAGALVDRWDRRRTMIVCDIGSSILPVITAALLWTGQLMIWHIWVIVFSASLFTTFQRPAFAASIALLAPKEQLGRANGMVQLALGVAQLIAPAFAGILIATIQIEGVLLLDFATFLFSLVTLLLVRFASVSAPAGAASQRRSLLGDVATGWTYLRRRGELLQLMMLIATSNFLFGFVQALAQPMMLAFGTTPLVVGVVLTIGGSGMLVGALAVSIWGGPRRRVHNILGFLLLCAPALMLGGVRPSVSLIAIAAFVLFFCQPFINSAFYALMQTKIDSSMQGRIFSISQMVTSTATPIALLLAGPLADYLLNPLLVPGGTLAGSLGRIIGVGPGRGIGLLFIGLGVLLAALVVGAYLSPNIRNAEERLPDALPDADQPFLRAADTVPDPAQ